MISHIPNAQIHAHTYNRQKNALKSYKWTQILLIKKERKKNCCQMSNRTPQWIKWLFRKQNNQKKTIQNGNRMRKALHDSLVSDHINALISTFFSYFYSVFDVVFVVLLLFLFFFFRFCILCDEPSSLEKWQIENFTFFSSISQHSI